MKVGRMREVERIAILAVKSDVIVENEEGVCVGLEVRLWVGFVTWIGGQCEEVRWKGGSARKSFELKTSESK